MKRFAAVAAGAAIMTLSALGTARAGFVVGGENGWQLSTDGFVNVFAIYQTTEKRPNNVLGGFLATGANDVFEAQQTFNVRTGLLPEGIGFNIKAPTTNGLDMGVRIGIYPQIQNHYRNTNIDITPNIDFREIYFTAEGKYGQLLAGRAINLYQAKNILTDMTLFTVGIVGPVDAGPTMGHIGYGYLYPNFGAQIRYTTPSMSGLKVAFSVNDAYDIGYATTTNVPKLETEISYANGPVQAWLSGLYQQAGFSTSFLPRPNGHVTSLGGAGGVQVGIGGLSLLASAYGGTALGTAGVQSGLSSGEMDYMGNPHTDYGFLLQAVYTLNPEWKFGINYGQSRQDETDYEEAQRHGLVPVTWTGPNPANGFATIKSQQAVSAMVTYNLNKNLQFIGEYSWGQDQWYNAQSQMTNVFTVGTFFYW